jgi:hypothetical protein
VRVKRPRAREKAGGGAGQNTSTNSCWVRQGQVASRSGMRATILDNTTCMRRSHADVHFKEAIPSVSAANCYSQRMGT